MSNRIKIIKTLWEKRPNSEDILLRRVRRGREGRGGCLRSKPFLKLDDTRYWETLSHRVRDSCITSGYANELRGRRFSYYSLSLSLSPIRRRRDEAPVSECLSATCRSPRVASHRAPCRRSQAPLSLPSPASPTPAAPSATTLPTTRTPTTLPRRWLKVVVVVMVVVGVVVVVVVVEVVVVESGHALG